MAMREWSFWRGIVTRDQAIEILNRALLPYRKQFIFEANLYKAGLVFPASQRAFKNLKDLDQAVEVILFSPIQLDLL
jgi:hypothetical protein